MRPRSPTNSAWRRILVPPRPGAFSALGLLCTDVVHDYIRSELKPARRRHAPTMLKTIFATLEAKARERHQRRGHGSDRRPLRRELDLRYTGQGYELRTPLDGLFDGRLTADIARRARGRVSTNAMPRFTVMRQGPAGGGGELSAAPARRRCPNIEQREEQSSAPRPAADARKGERAVCISMATGRRRRRFTNATGSISAPRSAGPAIIEQFDATTVSRRTGPRRRRPSQPDPDETGGVEDGRQFGRHHHPDPAQQDRQPGRRNALSFLSLRLFDHHPRIARLLLRHPRSRRAAHRGAADVLPRPGLSASGRAHPRALRRRRGQRHPGRRRVRLQSPLRRRPAACLRHGVRRAGLRRRQDRRLCGLDRPQGRSRRHGRGIDLRQCHRVVPRRLLVPPIKIWDAGPASAGHRAPDPRQQPAAGAGARRHACADRRHPDGRRPGRQLCARFGADDAERGLRRHPQRLRPTNCVPRSPACRTATASARRPPRQRRRRGGPAGQARRHDHDRPTASSTSISRRRSARPKDRSICVPPWSRPACSIA